MKEEQQHYRILLPVSEDKSHVPDSPSSRSSRSSVTTTKKTTMLMVQREYNNPMIPMDDSSLMIDFDTTTDNEDNDGSIRGCYSSSIRGCHTSSSNNDSHLLSTPAKLRKSRAQHHPEQQQNTSQHHRLRQLQNHHDSSIVLTTSSDDANESSLHLSSLLTLTTKRRTQNHNRRLMKPNILGISDDDDDEDTSIASTSSHGRLDQEKLSNQTTQQHRTQHKEQRKPQLQRQQPIHFPDYHEDDVDLLSSPVKLRKGRHVKYCHDQQQSNPTPHNHHQSFTHTNQPSSFSPTMSERSRRSNRRSSVDHTSPATPLNDRQSSSPTISERSRRSARRGSLGHSSSSQIPSIPNDRQPSNDRQSSSPTISERSRRGARRGSLGNTITSLNQSITICDGQPSLPNDRQSSSPTISERSRRGRRGSLGNTPTSLNQSITINDRPPSSPAISERSRRGTRRGSLGNTATSQNPSAINDGHPSSSLSTSERSLRSARRGSLETTYVPNKLLLSVPPIFWVDDNNNDNSKRSRATTNNDRSSCRSQRTTKIQDNSERDKSNTKHSSRSLHNRKSSCQNSVSTQATTLTTLTSTTTIGSSSISSSSDAASPVTRKLIQLSSSPAHTPPRNPHQLGKVSFQQSILSLHPCEQADDDDGSGDNKTTTNSCDEEPIRTFYPKKRHLLLHHAAAIASPRAIKKSYDITISPVKRRYNRRASTGSTMPFSCPFTDASSSDHKQQSANRNSHRPKKKVQFSIQTTAFEIEAIPEELYSKIWWSDADSQKNIQRQADKINPNNTKSYSKSATKFVQAVIACKKELLENDQKNSNSNNISDKDNTKTMYNNNISEHTYTNLIDGIHNGYHGFHTDSYMDHVPVYVTKIVKMYQSMKQIHCTDQHIMKLIHVRSETLTKRDRYYASMIGQICSLLSSNSAIE